ncbi:3'-5' exonuclease [Nitratiruptor sp. YY09-18]|uniref:3'-5' exonuclease n=1 Tax=Nitratiruptor sp. YY09-18 TaxID=2724901 RepID=UPI001916378F|nr:3'-5' exonuclease [Nitratiruptor sp. YY09-18]
MNKLEKLAQKLIRRSYPKEQFLGILQNLFGMFEDPEIIYQTLIARGFPLAEKNGKVYLKTAKTPYKNQEFTVVDIETSGSKPEYAQVIEIGAIKFRGDKVIDRFESFIYADEIPEYISKLTGIIQTDLENAPLQKEVLKQFKEFLGDSVFVAHNVHFDYNFISSKLEQLGFGKLANRRLCSIDLAKKTIESERYGLEYLNESLGINTAVSHRAYADALTAWKVMQKALQHIPNDIRTTEDLIHFSKKAKSKRLPSQQNVNKLCSKKVTPVVDSCSEHIEESVNSDNKSN